MFGNRGGGGAGGALPEAGVEVVPVAEVAVRDGQVGGLLEVLDAPRRHAVQPVALRRTRIGSD